MEAGSLRTNSRRVCRGVGVVRCASGAREIVVIAETYRSAGREVLGSFGRRRRRTSELFGVALALARNCLSLEFSWVFIQVLLKSLTIVPQTIGHRGERMPSPPPSARDGVASDKSDGPRGAYPRLP